MSKALALVAFVMGCGGGDATIASVDTPADASTGSNGSGKDGGGGSNNNNDGSDAGGGGDAGTTPQVDTIRFVAFGDTGKGNADQKDVASAAEAKCKASGCDFAILLGDNIYDSGASSTTDQAWNLAFEEPYKNITLDFFAVLGNHDYGVNGLGIDATRAQVQVDYTKVSQKWKMPAKYYELVKKHVTFIALDTNAMMFGQDEDQRRDVPGMIAKSATWKIALGHHPYLSNGPHGNAGRYEGIPGVPVVSGGGVKSFFDDVVCGKVDLYLCGHDHSRQWLQDKCGGTTELIVNGAGAAVTELKGSNKTHYQNNTLGFVYFVIEGKKLTAHFIDKAGTVEHTRSITK